MSDVPQEPDGDELFTEEEAARQAGLDLFEMADRLKPMHACAPGLVAKRRIEIDGQWYEIALRAVADGN